MCCVVRGVLGRSPRSLLHPQLKPKAYSLGRFPEHSSFLLFPLLLLCLDQSMYLLSQHTHPHRVLLTTRIIGNFYFPSSTFLLLLCFYSCLSFLSSSIIYHSQNHVSSCLFSCTYLQTLQLPLCCSQSTAFPSVILFPPAFL